MKRKSRWIWGGICIAIFAVVIIVVSSDAVLIRMGEFMAPVHVGSADVIIMEGTEHIEQGAVSEGIRLLRAGHARRIVLIIHQPSPLKRIFALEEDYPELVRKKILSLGLKEKQLTVLVMPVRHPVTLIEASTVIEKLSQENVKSALLLANGFHTRRSFLVYRHVGKRGINIIPLAYFNDYRVDDWWRHEEGLREFAAEVFKLAYYWIRYIPFSSGGGD